MALSLSPRPILHDPDAKKKKAVAFASKAPIPSRGKPPRHRVSRGLMSEATPVDGLLAAAPRAMWKSLTRIYSATLMPLTLQ